MDSCPGRVLARGNTAEVRTFGDGRVCKLYADPGAVESARYEARATRAASEAGVSVPSVGGVVTVEGRIASVVPVAGPQKAVPST